MNLLRGQVSVVDDQVGIAGDDGWVCRWQPEPGRRALASGGQVSWGSDTVTCGFH